MAAIILQLHQDSMVGIDRVQSRRLMSMGNVTIQPLYDQIAPVFEGLGKRVVVGTMMVMIEEVAVVVLMMILVVLGMMMVVMILVVVLVVATSA